MISFYAASHITQAASPLWVTNLTSATPCSDVFTNNRLGIHKHIGITQVGSSKSEAITNQHIRVRILLKHRHVHIVFCKACICTEVHDFTRGILAEKVCFVWLESRERLRFQECFECYEFNRVSNRVGHGTTQRIWLGQVGTHISNIRPSPT